ncbi:protein SENESCENCE-ASSOCIATED GENE 21, mitochondrial [Nicotiana tabacum]|uniref:Protein SENESCENCE-ASSOCIATED GENE 21, mitochondrial n=1 Tax=Nicotiana tabacum TaxID=4097 RepID=A0A1S3XFV2_TOBAC|nr:protein SENESCENCE-ASSOCIATED GENE 21, mitochondrial [Nicotiana tomentosiformis]XP_016438752.1 PREDICTED: protein SENESCENCE-ASSOCIATED GENE 21, mitochondrial-like [Nicotiana tabacum]
MARSFSNSKLISAFVVDTVSSFVSRRGYASSAGVRGSGVINIMMKKGGEESSKRTTSWVPDPVTGYYRPESHAKEIDAAELRQMLLKHKPRQH